MATVEERREWREAFLLTLYEIVGDDTLAREHHEVVADRAGIPKEDAYRIAQWNVAQGWAAWPVMGGFVAITHLGIERAEQLYDAGIRSSIPLVLSLEERGTVEAVTSQVRRAIEADELELDDDQRAEALADLDTVAAQLRSPRPVRRVVKAALEGLGVVVLGAAGSALYALIDGLVRKL